LGSASIAPNRVGSVDHTHRKAFAMSSNGHQPHILVLNSSKGFLDLMRTLLQEEGYRVSTENKAHETTDDIASLNPDLLIIDFVWANDDAGWRLLQTLKLDPRTKQIPAILCTTGVREVEALAPQLTKMEIEVVIKPFDLDDILLAIRKKLPMKQ
jgi:CheY-like chemotaxis protein